MPFSHVIDGRKNSFLERNSKYNGNGMRRKSPTLTKTAGVDHPTSTSKPGRQSRETHLAPDFDLAMGMLLE